MAEAWDEKGNKLPDQTEPQTWDEQGRPVQSVLPLPRPRPEIQPADVEYVDPATGMIPASSENPFAGPAGRMAGRTVLNVPHSAAEFGKAMVQPIIHPIQTAQDLGAIGGGVMQHLGMMQGEQYKPYATAVGKMLMDRYGSWDAIKSTMENDPVGMAADISLLFTGVGGVATRAPGAVGRLGEAAVTAGRAIDPLSAVSRPVTAAAPYIGHAVAEAAGILPGVGGAPVREAFTAGATGGEKAAAFRRHLTGAGEMEEPVEMAMAGMRQLNEKKGTAYQEAIRNIAADTRTLPLNKLDARLANATKIDTYGDLTARKSTAEMREALNETIGAWKDAAYRGTANYPPEFYRTAMGFDLLKRMIGDLSPTGEMGSPKYRAQNALRMDAYNAVRQSIIDAHPEYGKIMRAYETAEKELNELSRELSLPRSAQQQVKIGTSLRKMQAALRNNVSSAYGHRAELAQYLAENGAPHLMAALAGQALQTPLPRGLSKFATQIALELGAFVGLGHGVGLTPAQMALGTALLPASSPRLVGEAAYGAGAARRGIAAAGRAVPPLTGLGRPYQLMGRVGEGLHPGQPFAHGGSVGRKRTQASVHYKDNRGTLPRHCGNCSMFERPHGCSAVEGRILSQGKCDIWAAKKKLQEGGEVPLEELPPHIRAAVEQPRTPPPSWNAALGMPEVPAPIVPPRPNRAMEHPAIPPDATEQERRDLAARRLMDPRFWAEEAFPKTVTGLGQWVAEPGREWKEGATLEQQIPWAGGTALGMMGMGVGRAASPMGAPRPGEFDLGIFGGRGAKTADYGMLQKALKMEDAGVAPESIWNQTGWVRRADNQWRFEIPDQDAAFHPLKPVELGKTSKGDRIVGLEGYGPLFTVIDHPFFREAYPQFGNVMTEVRVHPGLQERGFTDVRRQPGGAAREPVHFFAQGPDQETALSVLLHEMQHAVQEHEGFAPGASPNYLQVTPAQVTKVAKRLASEQGLDYAMLSPFARKDLQKDARFDIYERNLGEVEARNVQARREFEHRQVMPQATEKIPVERQIVGHRQSTGEVELPSKQVLASEQGPRGPLQHTEEGLPFYQRIENVPPGEERPYRSPLGFEEPLAAAPEFTEHPGIISTRLPTAVGATENPMVQRLGIGVEEMKRDPRVFNSNADVLRRNITLNDAERAGTREQVVQRFMDRAVDNLLWLHDQVPEAIRARAKEWYAGGNNIVKEQAGKYNLPDSSVAGVYASLSPQKDWFQNVSLGDRVLDIVHNHQNTPFTTAMTKVFKEKILPASENPVNLRKLYKLVEGKTLGELSPNKQALWLRLYDEAHNPREFNVISPEGKRLGAQTTKGGESRDVAWGTLDQIENAINSIYSGGDTNILSPLMGDRHKVRNFYNNLLHPNAPYGDVTIDTHAIAAAQLRALAGAHPDVVHGLGGSGGKSSLLGVNGGYGIYADAYRRAAELRGILPREMQSITWEAVRGLFEPEWKRVKKNVADVDRLWHKYRMGQATLDETRQAILERAGGIKPPDWVQ